MTEHIKLSIEEWKAKVQTSSHVRSGETIEFRQNKYAIRAWNASHPNMFLGCYSISGAKGFEAGRGWWHE